MDPKDIPYGDSEETVKKEQPATKEPPKEKPQPLSVIDDEDGDDEDEDDGEDYPGGIDDEANEEVEAVPFFKTGKGIAIIAAGALILIAAAWFIFFKSEPEPPPAPPTEEVADPVNPKDVMREELYQIGIGKESLDSTRIYEQGNIESEDFRKDFTNTGVAESYALPIEVVGVNDSVSYVKHRTVTGNGVDVYWAEATYKSQKTVFTMPYYIWQTLSPEGVMDVVVEVITDDNGAVYIGSVTAVPPNSN